MKAALPVMMEARSGGKEGDRSVLEGSGPDRPLQNRSTAFWNRKQGGILRNGGKYGRLVTWNTGLEVHMNKVESIEKEIEKLSSEELAKFRNWYAAFDAEVWDRQFEADVNAGKLDALADKALRDHSSGKTTKF